MTVEIITHLDDLVSDGGATMLDDGIYLVPVDYILDNFDSVDDNSDSIDDDDFISLADVLDDKRETSRYGSVLASIATFGFTQSLACSHTCRLLDGHHRLAAAIDLGYKSVPVAFYHSLPTNHKEA
jgi:hypothetical protein